MNERAEVNSTYGSWKVEVPLSATPPDDERLREYLVGIAKSYFENNRFRKRKDGEEHCVLQIVYRGAV